MNVMYRCMYTHVLCPSVQRTHILLKENASLCHPSLIIFDRKDVLADNYLWEVLLTNAYFIAFIQVKT